jgi:hypothetical protein
MMRPYLMMPFSSGNPSKGEARANSLHDPQVKLIGEGASVTIESVSIFDGI